MSAACRVEGVDAGPAARGVRLTNVRCSDEEVRRCCFFFGTITR